MTASLDGVLDALSRSFVERHPGGVAEALEDRPSEEVASFLAAHADAAGARVLGRLAPHAGQGALEELDEDSAVALVKCHDPHRAAALLGRLDEERREALLARLSAEQASELRELIRYPEDTAGGLMDPRVAAFHFEDTVGDVIEYLRREAGRRVQNVYVVDAEGRLAGAATLQDVALAPASERLDQVATLSPAHVQATASREEVIEQFERRRTPSLPVVDFDGRLLGVIRQAALVEAAQEEASIGVQTMVGASRDERALSPAFFAVRKRLPWLQVNLATAFLAAAVVGLFEGTIAKFTALAVLLPVVAGQSGNTGAQALAVTMRGLALREVRARQWLAVARKETLAALVNGLAVAVTTCAGVYVWSGSAGLTLVIGISMVVSMALAGLSGALIPMLLTALGQDPAQSSSIVLTTVTDVAGFLSFLGIATALSFLL
jgi:magnesium transporter